MDDITSGMKNIESEAEKILESARSQANETLLNAKEEAGRILSAELPMDEVKAECRQIVHKAKEEAEKIAEDTENKIARIRHDANKKVEEIAERMVSIITGAGDR